MKGKGAAHAIATCAVMTALLIAVQYALGFVPGVELVTVFLLAFCYVFGAKYGVIVATAFSLLRCFVWGFYPNIIVLYLIYFNVFALLFGLLGGRERPVAVWVCPVLLALLAAGCMAGALIGIPVSVLYRARLSAMLWALFGVLAGLLALYIALWAVGGRRAGQGREAASLAALAALCTVCFTLLDDVLTPLFYGYSFDAAVAYFYAGFFAMLPQTICTVLSVLLLFYPLRKVFAQAAAGKRRGERVRRRARAARKRRGESENASSNDGRTQKDVV